MAITKDVNNLGNGSEIFFNAWNGSEGYTLDLDLESFLGDWIGTDPFFGQTAQTTLDAAAVSTDQYDANGVLFDGELTEFSTAFGGDFTGVEWTLVAFDNVGINRSIVTADTSITATAGTNDQAKDLAGTLENMANGANSFEGTSDDDTYHITSATDGNAYAGQFGSTYQGNVFDTSNALGVTSSLYMVAQADSTPAQAASTGLVQEISTASGTAVTATTYEENGVWKLKIEAAGATDGTKETSGGNNGNGKHTSAFAQADVESFAELSDGSYVLVGADGTNETFTESTIVFTDGEVSVADFSATAAEAPVWSGFVPTKYVNSANPELEALYDYQLLGTTGGDSVIAGDTNDFMNLGEGDDAAQGGAGNDILDGGLGSNFLTGGTGNDTFFLDGRGSGTITWSTVTDFTSGDFVNIWGWVEGTSVLLLTQDSAGAAGFEGITHHYDLDADGTIDTSITFTGLTEVPTNSAQEVAGNGYLFFA